MTRAAVFPPIGEFRGLYAASVAFRPLVRSSRTQTGLTFQINDPPGALYFVISLVFHRRQSRLGKAGRGRGRWRGRKGWCRGWRCERTLREKINRRLGNQILSLSRALQFLGAIFSPSICQGRDPEGRAINLSIHLSPRSERRRKISPRSSPPFLTILRTSLKPTYISGDCPDGTWRIQLPLETPLHVTQGDLKTTAEAGEKDREGRGHDNGADVVITEIFLRRFRRPRRAPPRHSARLRLCGLLPEAELPGNDDTAPRTSALSRGDRSS